MYKIIYEDGSEFQGGEPKKSLWDSIDKPIRQLNYSLGNKSIILRGYEMYNHVVEHACISNKGTIITRIVLLGLIGNIVTGFVFNVQKKKIEMYKAKLGREFNGRLTTGWRNGIPNLKPDFILSKI